MLAIAASKEDRETKCPWCNSLLLPPGFHHNYDEPCRCLKPDCAGHQVMMKPSEWRDFGKYAITNRGKK